MKVNKKLLFGLLVIAAFSTFFWSTSSTVVAETAGPSQAKSDQFWIDNQGYVDQIIYKVITQDELLVEATRTGEIDIVGQFVDVALLKPSDFSDPNLGLTQTRRRGFGHVTFNNQEFPVSVRAMRQGFAYALDKVDLQQRALGGASFTADSPVVGSLGVWSCEYEFTLSPCSPTGETYYDPQVGIGNTTILNAGFYDSDGDGFREFFNGNVTHTTSGLIWSGSSVAQGNVLGTTSGYPDPNWNGYTYKGADGVRRTFSEVNVAMGGIALGPDSSGAANLGTGMTADWEEVSFTVTGSAGSNIVTAVITMTSEAFYAMGIKADTEFITFAALLATMSAGDFKAVFFAYSGLGPDPTFLQLFDRDAVNNIDRQRWFNDTFSDLWNIIDQSSDFDTVLQASFDAQQMYWQEQPIVVMYNNELTSLYRIDKYDGFVTVPGTGAFGGTSTTKIHLKNTLENWDKYPNYPLGGTYVFGLPQPMDSQNQIFSNNAYTGQVLGTIEESMFGRNPEDLTFIPNGLAWNWTIEAPYTDTHANGNVVAGSKFTFNLLDNVTWHNGEAFTSEDVKYTFSALISNTSPTFFDSLQNIIPERTETPTLHQVIIYSNSSGLFEFGNTGASIYQKSYWNQFTDIVTHTNPIPQGTGPYKWVSSTPGEFYLQERNDNYYRKPTPESFLRYFDMPTEETVITTTTTGPTTTTTGTETQAAPGFEILVTLFGMMAVSVVFLKLRRR